jgi:hypothetical protein
MVRVFAYQAGDKRLKIASDLFTSARKMIDEPTRPLPDFISDLERYFLTGSVAQISFGEPRFANNIGIVIDFSRR